MLQECFPVSLKARLTGPEKIVGIRAIYSLVTYTEEGDKGYL